MIRHRVSAVLQLRDGFLGRPVEGHGVRCRLDGAVCRPQAKPGGYLVWTDLPAGTHRLTVCLPGYQPEEIEADIREDGMWQGCASLKPGAGYPFSRDAVHICLTVEQDGAPLADAEVWLAPADEALLKIAQDKAAAKAQQLRLFSKAGAGTLPVPGVFLVEDKKPELVQLQSVEQGEGTLAAPLAFAHARGRGLLPAQRYRTDANGQIALLLRSVGKMAAFYQNTMQYIELQPGETSAVLCL